MHRGAIALLAGLGLARLASAQATDSYRKAFELADSQPRIVIQYLECLVKHGRFAGQVGTGADVVCARVGGSMLAAVVERMVTGERFIFTAVDVNTAMRIDRPDTAEVLTMLRAQILAGSRALIAVGADTLPLLPPVVYRADSVIHAWVIPFSMIPMPTGAYTGGIHHYVLDRNARQELSRTPIAPRSPITGIRDGDWVIESTDSIPTFSELLMAHILRMDSRPVSIVMPTRIAKLSGDARTITWAFLPRKH